MTTREVRGAAFSIRARFEGDCWSVFFSGYLDMESVPHLREFLLQLSTELDCGAVSAVEFEVSPIFILGSTALSCFAGFVTRTKTTHPNCKIRFRTDPSSAWQGRALGPIRRLAEDMVAIL
ncbi:MAG: hypothetical protein QM784_06075 [Polyangiaceae bacterium]